jgi:hypothetical protein
VFDPSDWRALSQWFREQPSGVLITIATRAALRALPLAAIRQDMEPNAFLSGLVLPLFRGALASWAVANHSTQVLALQQFATATANAIDSASLIAQNAVASRVANSAHNAVVVAANAYNHAANDLSAYTGTAQTSALTVVLTADAFAEAGSYPVIANADALAAAQADIETIELGETFEQRIGIARALARAPLWPKETPAVATEAWLRIRSILSSAEDDWDVWINWYEDRLAGQPPVDAILDIARAMLPTELWEQGPKVLNAEFKRLAEAARELQNTPPDPLDEKIALLMQAARALRDAPSEPIPRQGAGPHFMVGQTGMIALTPPVEVDAQGNNLTRIRQLLPLVRRAAADLLGHLNPNAFPELARDIEEYRAAVAVDEMRIPWGTVFGLGVMLENAREASQRDLTVRLQPTLEDAARAALDSMLTLHGPLILSTAEGRELADQADRMNLTLEQQAKLREDVQAVARQLQNAAAIIEPPAAKVVAERRWDHREGSSPRAWYGFRHWGGQERGGRSSRCGGNLGRVWLQLHSGRGRYNRRRGLKEEREILGLNFDVRSEYRSCVPYWLGLSRFRGR